MRLDNEPAAVLMGHPSLFEKQKEISADKIHSDDFQHNLMVLKNSQYRLDGIGLAAPQIGWMARVFCLGIDNNNRNRYAGAPDIPFQFWINPKIRAVSPTTSWGWEGCISVPGIRGWIERPSHVDVEGLNEKGEVVQMRMTGFAAKVFQHELDHLNGTLFTMRVSDIHLVVPMESMKYQSQWAKKWPTPSANKTPPGVLSPSR
ncbi:MAG: peptide deformylase [Endozoicomonadaceae bacterium]|nr:peptide deformylase [Endozoicomonadaceae bacterium]